MQQSESRPLGGGAPTFFNISIKGFSNIEYRFYEIIYLFSISTKMGFIVQRQFKIFNSDKNVLWKLPHGENIP